MCVIDSCGSGCGRHVFSLKQAFRCVAAFTLQVFVERRCAEFVDGSLCGACVPYPGHIGVDTCRHSAFSL